MPVSVKILSDGAVVADFGVVMAARPDVQFQSGQANRTLNMLTGYELTSDGHVLTATAATQSTDMSFRYIERAGAQEFQAFTYLGWRYLQISAPGETLTTNDFRQSSNIRTRPSLPNSQVRMRQSMQCST